jgi:hypothetical protein
VRLKTSEGDKKASRLTFEDFKKKALANPDVEQTYDALSTTYTLKKTHAEE